MKCSIHRWNISRALDSGEPLAGLTKHHLVHCEACLEFWRVAEETGRRLTDDATSLLQEMRSGFGERLSRSIRLPAQGASPHRSRPKPWQVRPVLAAVILLTAVGISLIWMLRSHPAGMPRLNPLLNLEAQRANLLSALEKAESPYQKEITELKKTFQSTADYLAARFETRLGENN